VLVIVYDEHGGFYDHVTPPSVADDGSGYKTLGVRVPALIAGPRVQSAPSHDVFEHTSLIKTILSRFAANPEHALRAMPERVRKAPHLGVLLEDAPRTGIEGRGQLRHEMTEWRAGAHAARRAENGPSAAPDGAGHHLELHDFQHEFAQFALAMRDAGLPPGQP
jgi:phospholipase C